MLGEGRGLLLLVEPLGILEHVPRLEIVLHGVTLVWLLLQQDDKKARKILVIGLSGLIRRPPEAESLINLVTYLRSIL